MACNCKKKKTANLEETTLTYTWEEVVEAVNIINTKQHYTFDEQELLYDLHNRMFPKNKQYNFNCGDCFKVVIRNIIRYYDGQKQEHA